MPDDDILSIQNVSFDCIVIGKQRDYTNYANTYNYICLL